MSAGSEIATEARPRPGVLRTPELRFERLEGFPWPPSYVDVEPGLRMAYVDTGARAARETMLLLHGEPTWGYLYRKMIPPLEAAGFRVVVPDLIGFGRSDKPVDPAAYSYSQHVAWVTRLVEHLDLHDATLFGQDWGGLIGTRVVAENERRFARLVLYFLSWRVYSQEVPELIPSRIVPGWCLQGLSAGARAAYDAPFPTQEYVTGARRFPLLVPITADDPEREKCEAAWAVYERWQKPLLTLWGDLCPFTHADLGRSFHSRVPGARLPGIEHKRFAASHFSQEDVGAELAAEMIAFVRRFPARRSD